jgi:hypothetical protein
LPADFFQKGRPVTPDPCSNGLPAGARIEPFTAEEIAAFNLIGATTRQDNYGANWFSARLTTAPASNKCLTKIEFQIVLGPVGEEYPLHATASGLSVQPGWGWTGGDGVVVSFPTRHHEQPELISWKVAGAWGYAVPSQ